MDFLYDASPPGLLMALYGALLIWAIAAYVSASIAGVRALRLAYDGPPARPLCLVSDTTRWLFARPLSPRKWRPRDFVALGLFLSVVACLMRLFLLAETLAGIDWLKPPPSYALRTAAIHVLSGSALIILHCGIALRFQRETKA